MKKFFFQVLSSFMGAWLAIVLAGIVAVILVVALVGSMIGGAVPKLEKNSPLLITLEGVLEEREAVPTFDIGGMLWGNSNKVKVIAVETLVEAIKEAKDNDNVKCIYLDCRGLTGAPASMHAVRSVLADFKKSGKKIFAYADNFTQGDYYIASVADEIVLNPAGMVQMRGIGGVSIYFKDFLDKIGVEVQAVRVGEGKAAIEPYTSSHMSAVARQQNMLLFDSLWMGMRKDMSIKSRGLTPASIDSLVSRDMLSCRTASFALKVKLVTALEYRHKYEKKLAEYCGQKDGLKQVITPSELVQITQNDFNNAVDNQVAVLYACGGIDDFMSRGGINSSDVVEQVLDLAENDKVKALVLRVNSPGGSAFGSEQMWEALETFKKTGKPFVVSMGDYAASGGYYISCGAQRIYADPYTITGSIGIFGLIPNIHGLCDKLGLTPQMVATNPDALFPNLMYPLDAKQLSALQMMVNDGYELFVKRCAEGRHMPVAKIKEIADGRPIIAGMAKSYGLVDELGSLDDAVKYAAGKAKLKDWNAVSYPNAGSMLENLMQTLEEQQSMLAMTAAGDTGALRLFAERFIDSFSQGACLQASMPTYIFNY